MSYKVKSKSLVHKLNTRELYGGFKKKTAISALELFDKIPEEHIYNLGDVFEHLGSHVFMGPTQCGKFLMTYSIKRASLRPDRPDFGLPNLHYMLHLWSFSRAALQSKKVAEVHLFSGFSSEITSQLNITVAQWPNLHDKLIVYGESELNCPSSGDYHTSNTFLTITQLPALSTCTQCSLIADLFQLNGRQPNQWKANVNRCLKHGATLDALFMLAHPHPKLDIRVNIKCPNRFLVNTGNFLHVLSLEVCAPNELDQTKPSSPAPYSEENSKPIVSENGDYKIMQRLSRDSVLFKFLHAEDGGGGGSRKKSSGNYLFGNVKKDEQENLNIRKKVTCSPLQDSKERRDQTSGENLQRVKNIMAQADKIYAFEECEDGGCELKFKWFRKRKLADKMYEFCSDDEMENARFSNLLKELRFEYKHSSQPKPSKLSCGRFLKIRLNPPQRKGQNSPCERDEMFEETPPTPTTTTAALLPQTDSLQSELFLKTDSFCSKPDNCDISSIISDWESQDTCSLSPKSDISNLSDFSTGSTPGTSTGLRFSLKNKKPRLCLKKYTSTNIPSSVEASSTATASTGGERKLLHKSLCVILKPHNRLCYPVDDVKSSSCRLNHTPEPHAHQINLISGCCYDLERYYVLDESQEQTIESEVDCCEDGNQVPIVVRGPSRLWSSKLKHVSEPSQVLGNEYCLVKQKTLDIEQVCFKAADLICKNENYNFRSCNDYDVEIVNVCPRSGDVIASVSIRMNAVNSRTVPAFKKYPLPDCPNRAGQFLSELRKEFDTCCILVWNLDTQVCRVEAYTPLRPLPYNSNPTHWYNQTLDVARNLKFQNLGYFNVPCLLPRSFTHRLKTEKCGEEIVKESVREIHDKDNLVGFRLDDKFSQQEDETDSEDDIDETLLL
uniref:DDB1- and CUL4-associated factor 15 n=1 Tax=Cacopsylla melanoneura TaxID=428564 RepID=A0A8D9DPM1_9HEMI